MIELLRTAARIAASNVPVLICGETGTGKEVLARAIHKLGGAARPFVPIDCCGLPEQLVESELFGHVKGAFTGASVAKLGLIALADGGTIFLDEVGELPLYQQAKLLRLLQEREFRPVGSTQTTRLQFRVLAATNRDLRAEVRAGRFRADLFYRLAAVRLSVPPLRERREDIPALIRLFSKQHQQAFNIPIHVVAQLAALEWPGNVRQLQNCIGCMTLLQECPLLGTKAQCDTLTSAELAPLEPVISVSSAGEQDSLSLARVERRTVASALNRTGGDKARAAELLGIGRTTLYRRLKEYELAS